MQTLIIYVLRSEVNFSMTFLAIYIYVAVHDISLAEIHEMCELLDKQVNAQKGLKIKLLTFMQAPASPQKSV